MTHIRLIADDEAIGELADLYGRIRRAYRSLLGFDIPTPGPYRSPSLITAYTRFGIEQAEGIIASRTSGPQALAPDVIVDFSISIYSSCFYCSESNGAKLAEIYRPLQSVEQLLDDPQSAPIPQSHRAVFDWAETFARRSWTFTADHLKTLRGVGMDDAAIVHMAVKGAIQTWMMMMADGAGVPLESGEPTGPGVGRLRQDYHDAPDGLSAAERGVSLDEPEEEAAGARCWVSCDEDSAQFRAVAKWAQAHYGAVPNLLRAVSLAPGILATQQMALELLEGPQSNTVTPRQHAMVRVLANALNRGRYGRERAWQALRETDGDVTLRERLTVDHTHSNWNAADRVILDFAAKAVRNAHKIVAADAQAFRDVGLDEEGYLDVLCTAALQTAHDRLANALGVTPDSA